MKNDTVILGASGFIGRHLTRLSAVAPSSRELDLLSLEASSQLSSLIGPKSKIIMLSALTPDRGKDLKAMESNITMAANLCRAVERSGAKQIVLVSSDAVYPDSEVFISESTRTDTSNLYGLGHSVREKVITEAAVRLGISLLILRPSAMYGFGDTHNSYGPNRFIKTAKERGEIALFGDGSDKRDHLYVEDLVSCIEYGLSKELTGTYNINSGTAVSFREAADIVAEAFMRALKAPVKITTSATKPPTFRHFDPTARLSAFPTLLSTPLATGIDKVIEKIANS